MNIIKQSIFLLFICICLSQKGKSNPKNHTSCCINKFSDEVTEALIQSHIPGAAIAVVSKNKVLYMKTHGVKNIETGEHVDQDTLFRIASVSKFFTSLVLCRLHETGVLNINHNAIDYLPTLSLCPKAKFANVKIIDILNHTSGAPQYSLEDQAYLKQERDVLLKKIKVVTILYPPGRVYGYQNVIYSLLGLVVESATGTSFSSVLEKEILKPLQIKNYALSDEDYKNSNNIAEPHFLDKKNGVYRKSKCYSFYDNILPAGGISISVKETIKIIQALLNNNKPITKDILSILTSHKIKVCSKSNPCNKLCFCKKGLTSYYGLGCRIVNISGYDVIYHSGCLTGYSSIIAIIPAIEIGFIVFINKRDKLPFELLDKLCNILLGKKLGTDLIG
jgi:beta-lactamase class C